MTMMARPMLDATWDYFDTDMAHEAAAVRHRGPVRVLTVSEIDSLVAAGSITPIQAIGTRHEGRPMVFGKFLRGQVDPRDDQGRY